MTDTMDVTADVASVEATMTIFRHAIQRAERHGVDVDNAVANASYGALSVIMHAMVKRFGIEAAMQNLDLFRAQILEQQIDLLQQGKVEP